MSTQPCSEAQCRQQITSLQLLIWIYSCMLLSAAINVQQLARKRQERLGVLEYELRVAKEDLAETKVHGQAASHTVLEILIQNNSCMHAIHESNPNACRHLTRRAHQVPCQLPQPPVLMHQGQCRHQQKLMAALQGLEQQTTPLLLNQTVFLRGTS